MTVNIFCFFMKFQLIKIFHGLHFADVHLYRDILSKLVDAILLNRIYERPPRVFKQTA